LYGKVFNLKNNILVASILLLTWAAYSQHRIGDFLAYGNSNGLPASLYYSVCQSSDGYLWIGSSSGLVRFDGKRYEIFFSDYADTNTIADNVITDLVEDNNGNLWLAGFYQGISKYNLRTGKVKRYPNPLKGSGHAYGLLKIMKDPQGHIWAGTKEHGLGHYIEEKDDFEYFFLDDPASGDVSKRGPMVVSDIAIDRQDHNILWISGYDGLYAFHKNQKTFYRYIYNAPELKNQITPFLAVETDFNSRIWLGTWSDGLVSFDKITKTFEAYPYRNAEVSNSTKYQVIDVKSTNDSMLYLAARNSGLLSFNKATNTVQPLITNEMLPDGSSGIDIQQISITPDAGVFVGGNYYLYQQHPAFNRFSHSWQSSYGNNFSVYQSVYDSNRSGYWVVGGDAGGILFFSKDMALQRIYSSSDKRDLLFVDAAIDQYNAIWVVSHTSGLLKLDESDHTFKRSLNVFPGSDTISNKVLEIETDKEGNLWLATDHSLYFWSFQKNILQQFDLSVDRKSPISSIKLSAGSHEDAWVGSDQGLFHCEVSESSVINLLPNATDKNSIANRFVKSMTIDHEGNAWLGYESDGIQVVSRKDHSILARYTLKDGLPGMQINQMATDSAGRIWVGTSAGLALFNPHAEERVWQLFNREDGVKRDYIDRIITTTTDGKLFFNIDNGFSWIDIGHEHFTNDYKPILHIVSLLVNGKPYLKNDVLPEYIHSLSLPYSTKEISIEYAAMDWLHPFRTKYFYRIEGISQSQEWTENPQAMITLTGIKPGKYLLQIFAVNGEGIKSSVLELPILMNAPFWQRWWFIIICVLSALFLGYAIYRYRIGQFKKMQAMRNSISTNLHDDIGASLSNIHILTVLTQRNIFNPVNATSYISKAGDEIQRISESLSDIVWNINPKYDDLDQLFIRMKRYAADMFDGKNIQADLIFPDAAIKLSMPMDQRRDFYLIFKEAVNNLVKYSQATMAIVKVATDQQMIHLEVNDDGIGFDQDTMRYGNGMENMKQRAEKWKAVLHIRSEQGKGTKITLSMKVSQV
jgi:ligand-binding sensor domain-containing protein/two-component sensor histidine kinase